MCGHDCRDSFFPWRSQLGPQSYYYGLHECSRERFSCPFSSTHFNTSLIWAAIGPRRYFSNEIGYHTLLYFFIIGAVLPIPVYLLSRRYPNSLWKRVHIPLFLEGLNYLPPATGMNYGSWAVVGLTFGWFIRKRVHGWWSKYNFVLSSALDSSVGIAGVVLFLTFYFTGASKHFSWWGTEFYKVFRSRNPSTPRVCC